MSNLKSPIGLVLSGGGALGAAHVGALNYLETKYEPNYLIGTSAGAIVSAAIACGMSSTQISEYLKQKSILKVAFDFSIRGSGIIRGKKILELLKRIYEEKTFEDLPKSIKLRICATNFNSGEKVILKSGCISSAVRASLAIPGLFEPFWINNQPLVDGGLVSNLPLNEAIDEYKGNKIIAIDVCSYLSKSFLSGPIKRASFRQSIERSLKIFFLNQQSNIQKDSRVKIIRPILEGYNSADILRLSKIEKIGFEAASNDESI